MNNVKCVEEPKGWRELVDQDGKIVNLELISALQQDLLRARVKIDEYEANIQKLERELVSLK